MITLEFKKQFPDLSINVGTSFAPEITVLAGKSGSGKSTVLKMIAGFLRPDDGYVKVSGKDVFNHQRRINLYPEQRRIGYVPQNYLLFPHMNIFENVAFGVRELKQHGRELVVKVEEALDLCNLLPLSNRFPRDLSGGEQQRAALARAVVTCPSLLLLDEPFSALDIETRRSIRTDVRDILKEASIPAIMVTHDPLDALSFGNQVYIMEQGSFIQRGCFHELRNEPRSRFIAEFTGLSAFQGVSRRGMNGMLHVQLEEGPLIKAAGEIEGRVLVLFNPSDIIVSRKMPDSSVRNIFAARVIEIDDNHNGLCMLQLKGDLLLTAQISSESLHELEISVGVMIYASIKAAAIRLQSMK